MNLLVVEWMKWMNETFIFLFSTSAIIMRNNLNDI
jgi:hypothetical protein